MKAALFYGKKDIRIEDRALPDMGNNEAMIKIGSAGICGSDLHNYRGNQQSAWEAPWEQGHELAGTVVATGSGVNDISIGDRVGIEAEHLLGCEECDWCSSGNNHLCKNRGMLNGKKHASHGFSSHDAVLAKNCYKLPDHISFDHAALLDCYACGVHALNLVKDQHHNKPIIIMGSGAIAMTLGQIIKAKWSHNNNLKVIMIGTRKASLETALIAGAADEIVIGGPGKDIVNPILKKTGGEGASIVFETVGGNSQITQQCMDIAMIRGIVCIMGVFTKPQIIDSQESGMSKELSLLWSNSYSHGKNGLLTESNYASKEYQEALDYMSSGKINAAPLITHKFPQNNILAAFEAADNKATSGAIKVVINH